MRNNGEIGARGLIRFATSLFPIAQRAQGNMIAGGKLLLGQSERAPQSLDAWYPLHAGQIDVRQRLRVRIAYGGSCDSLVTRRHEWCLHCYLFLSAIRLDPYK